MSAVSGQLAGEEIAAAGYWVSHVREPVRFAAAVAALRDAGADTFVEVGPGAALCAMGAQCAAPGEDVAWVPGLRKGAAEPVSAVSALAGIWARGVAVDWPRWFGAGRWIDLPTRAFQHQRYWLSAPAGRGDPQQLGQAAAGHPLVSAAVELPEDGGLVLTGRLSLAAHPWLADHVITGRAVVPGAALAELAVAAADQAGCAMVEELVLHTPLVIPATGAVTLRVTIAESAAGGQRTAEIFSRGPDASTTWTRNATATLAPTAPPAAFDLATWPPPAADRVDLDGFYAEMARIGLDLGPSFQGLKAVWRRGDEVFAEAALPEISPPAVTGCIPHCWTRRCKPRPGVLLRRRREEPLAAIRLVGSGAARDRCHHAAGTGDPGCRGRIAGSGGLDRGAGRVGCLAGTASVAGRAARWGASHSDAGRVVAGGVGSSHNRRACSAAVGDGWSRRRTGSGRHAGLLGSRRAQHRAGCWRTRAGCGDRVLPGGRRW